MADVSIPKNKIRWIAIKIDNCHQCGSQNLREVGIESERIGGTNHFKRS